MILSFRPLMGIILFNLRGKNVALHTIVWFSFRPLMGIILFNVGVPTTAIERKFLKEFPSPNGDYFI